MKAVSATVSAARLQRIAALLAQINERIAGEVDDDAVAA